MSRTLRVADSAGVTGFAWQLDDRALWLFQQRPMLQR